MAVTRRNRIIIVAVAYQRQRRDAGGDLVAGVIGRRRQPHERGCVRLHALTDCRRLTAQDRLTPLHTGVKESGVERVETVRHRKRRHEVAPDISHQALDLALVVTLARSAKAVGEQIMALDKECEPKLFAPLLSTKVYTRNAKLAI